ncbi:MAG: glycosyltransferase family 4 protein [Nitrospirota bacterium]|nr:glycosyltransferase family 4 protein [Nitrospirota bacterium]
MSKRTKVFHIITKLELGGAQQNTLYTVGHLDRSRFEPYLIANDEGILVEEARKIPDLKTYFIPEMIREINPLTDFKGYQRIKAILRENIKPGEKAIVHTHSSKAGILGRWAAKAIGVPVIIHSIHGYAFHDFQHPFVRQAYITLEKITAPMTTKFIAVSQKNIETGVKEGIFARERAVLIRSGIDIARFRDVTVDKAALRRDLGVPVDAPLVGTVANFKPQKAPLDFIRVAELVRKEVPEAKFVYYGDGELRGEVESLIKKLKLEDTVILAGWRRDVPEILHCIDVFLLTSLWEGLPRVLPQAMSAGKPSVATAVDGSPEAVKDGENGYICEPRDVVAMAEKVVYLLKNPEIARRMGEKGRTMVDEWDIDLMVRQQEELYDALLR